MKSLLRCRREILGICWRCALKERSQATRGKMALPLTLFIEPSKYQSGLAEPEM
jgi:hypothetical protein